jgi:hypothetical protein
LQRGLCKIRASTVRLPVEAAMKDDSIDAQPL